MRRVACPERDDWRATADAAGFTFHTLGGERYWDERAYYGFTLDEIECQIETPTAEIDAMCTELVARATGDERYLRRLKIPEAFWPLIAESWRRRDASLYGRLDQPGPTEQERPGYGLLDVGAGLHLERVELDLVGRNLLDQAYLVSPDARATLAPGRTVVGTASVRF